jgi:hypothetical protein
MKRLEFKTDHMLDSMAIKCAIEATNIPEKIGVSTTGNAVYVDFIDDLEPSQKSIDAISKIIDAHKNTFDWAFIRKRRQPLLSEVDWRIQRALDEGEDATQLIEYRRALRDITKQESPDTVVWPTKPW